MSSEISVGGSLVQNNEGRSLPWFGNGVYSVEKTVTLAQVNAGLTLVAATPDCTFKVLRVLMIVKGTFLTLTDVRISDTNGTPVDVLTVPQASLTDAAVIWDGTASNTIGSLGVALTANQGIQIRKTGSSGTGGTSIFVTVMYKVNS